MSRLLLPFQLAERNQTLPHFYRVKQTIANTIGFQTKAPGNCPQVTFTVRTMSFNKMIVTNFFDKPKSVF